MQKKLLICASGTSNGGGTGCLDLVRHSENGTLNAEVVGILSDNERGGVREKAEKTGVPFFWFTSRFSYQDALQASGATTTVFCGWRRDVYGLDPAQTLAIVRYGGGREEYFDAHAYATAAYYRQNISTPKVIIRFLEGPTVNHGPVIIEIPVQIIVGPDFQLPRSRSRHDESTTPIFRGTPEERLERIVKYHMREVQNFFGYQILNHMLNGHVRYCGPGEPPACSELFTITREWIQNPLPNDFKHPRLT